MTATTRSGDVRRRTCRTVLVVAVAASVITACGPATSVGSDRVSSSPGGDASATDWTPYDEVAATWPEWPPTTFDDVDPEGYVHGSRIDPDPPVDGFDVDWLARCDLEYAPGSIADPTAVDWAPPDVSWYVLDVAPPTQESSARDALIDLTGIAPERGAEHGEAHVATTVARRMAVAAAYDADLYVAVGAWRGTSHVRQVAAVGSDGQVAFVGCGGLSTHELHEFATDHDREPVQVLDDVVAGEVTEDDLAAWEYERMRLPAWEELPADERSLDILDDVPAAAGETAVIVVLYDVDLEPEEQRGRIVCLASEVARSACVDLGMGFGSSIHRVSLEVPLRVELSDEIPAGSGEFVDTTVVATVAPEVLAEVAEDGPALRIRGLEDVDLDDVTSTERVTVDVVTEDELRRLEEARFG